MPPAHIPRQARGRGVLSSGGPVFCAFVAAALMHAAPAQAEKVRITNLSDVDFGTIANLQADSRRSQNICLYSNSAAGGYSVVAWGSGAGSTFSLADGPSSLAYDVEWSGQSGQSAGATLSPNVALTGQTSSATHQFCNSGPSTSASLTIILRAAELSRARQGIYSGTLTLLIAAE